MKKNLLLTLVACANLLLIIVACNEQKINTEPVEKYTPEQLIKRGEYLVKAIACDDCHTPKNSDFEFDFSRRLSGHPADEPIGKIDTTLVKNYVAFNSGFTSAVGPWGVSFAANLTSDETGIGNWTEERFFKAIREGKSKGLDDTRPLLPPMPWFIYKNLSDEDLRAIFAFLKSTKPIHNVVPAPKSLADVQQ